MNVKITKMSKSAVQSEKRAVRKALRTLRSVGSVPDAAKRLGTRPVTLYNAGNLSAYYNRLGAERMKQLADVLDVRATDLRTAARELRTASATALPIRPMTTRKP